MPESREGCLFGAAMVVSGILALLTLGFTFWLVYALIDYLGRH